MQQQQQHTGKDRSTADRLKGDGGNHSGGTSNNNNALLSLKGRLASRKERKLQQQQAAAYTAAAGEPQTQTQTVADGSPPLSSSCSPPSQVGNSSSQRSGGGKKSPKTRKAKNSLKRAQTFPLSSSASVSTPSARGQEQNPALASATKDEEQATLPEQEQPAPAPSRPPAPKFAATLEELLVRGLDWNTASSSSAKRVAQRLETDLQGGLSKQEALRRLKTYGPNKFLPPKSKKKRKEMGFQGKQEPLRPTTVIRGGERLPVPPESLVVGDLVEVVRGERIPADFRITHCSKDFCVDMHHLTGVKSPQFRSEKVHEAPWEANEVFAARNLALTSSTVCEGEAAGIVIATGNTTEFAQMVQGLLQVPRRRNNMDKTEKASKAVLKTLTRKWIFPKDPVAVAQLAYTDALVLDTEGLLTVGHPHASHVVVDVQLYSCTACGLDPFSNKSYAALLRAFALCTNASFLTSTSAFIPPLLTSSSLDDASGLDGDSQGISDSSVDGAPLPSPRAVASSPPTGGFSSPPPSPRSPRPTHKAVAGRDSSSLGVSQQQGAASASLSSSPTFPSPLQSNQIVAASKKLRVKELFSRKDKSAGGSLASTSPPAGVGATASEQASTNLVRSEYGSESSNMPSTSPTATSFGTSPPFLSDITAEGLPISSHYSLESLATLPIVGDKWDAAFLYFYEHAMVPPNVLRNYPAYEEARFEWPRVHAQAFESPIPWAVSVHRWRSKNKSGASLQKDSDMGAPKEKFSARAMRKRSQSLEERPPPAPPKKGGRRGTNERKKGKKRAGSDSETPVEASAREYSLYEHQEAEMQEQMLAERSFYYQRERINSEHPLPSADDEQINDPLEAGTDHARTEEETSSLEDGDLPSVGRYSSSSSSSSSKASSRRRRQRPTTGSSKRSTRYYDHRDRRQREKMAVPPSAASSTKGRAQNYSNPQRTFLVLLRGMPEVVFSKCNSFMLNGKRKKLSSRDLHTKMIIYQYLRTQGERVIAFAQKVLRDDKYPPDYEFGLDDFQGKFTLLGLASCIDRPYDNITHIVRKYQEAQIKLFMCTPLHPLPAKVLASACGIITAEQAVDGFFTKDGRPIPFISTAIAQESTSTAASLSSSADVEQRAAVVSGSALKDMTDETLQTILQQYEQVIFASMPVGLKFKIVGALQTLGYVVSVTGESVSEAAALKLADIGISFRRKGTAIAKNNADVILLKDDNGLPLLLNAIEIVKASRKKKKRSRDKVSSAAGAP